MNKVDWCESWLIRKLIDEKVDWWKSGLMRKLIDDWRNFLMTYGHTDGWTDNASC